MYGKKKDTNQEIEIKPQWISVKEELVNDFFNLADSYSNFTENPSNSAYRKNWVTSLKSLYLKIRLKIINNGNYRELVENMDKFVFKFSSTNLNEKAEYTQKLLQFIEEIGITKVEQEKLDPFEDFERTSFP